MPCGKLVQSLALSVINYCFPVYGITDTTLLGRVQKPHNFAAEMCPGGGKRPDHATPFITQLECLKIIKKIIFDVIVTVFKIKKQCSLTDSYNSLQTLRLHKVGTVHDNNTTCTCLITTQIAEDVHSSSWDLRYGTLYQAT